MTEAECKVETIKHIERVRHYLRIVTDRLTSRGVMYGIRWCNIFNYFFCRYWRNIKVDHCSRIKYLEMLKGLMA